MSQKRHSKNVPLKKRPPVFISPVPFYGMLVCGVLLLIIGIIMILTHSLASGIASAGRGSSGGRITFNGVTPIVLGLFLTLMPLYTLWKQYRQKDQRTSPEK